MIPTASPAAGHLYQGSAGVALFLAELSRITRDTEVRRAAQGGLRHVLAQSPSAFRTQLGLHDGRLGATWAAVRAGAALDEPAWMEAGAAIATELARALPVEPEVDVVSGAAGAIPALLDVAHRTQAPACADAAVRLGERLEGGGAREVWGWSWANPGIPSIRNLTGYAHGASGPAHALLELFAATGQIGFARGARQALAYERRFADPAGGGWPDFRLPQLARRGGSLSFASAAWCTGATGIGMVRARAWRVLGDPEARAEGLAAAERVRVRLQQPWEDVSLCHGIAGAADFLLDASNAFGAPALRAAAEAAGARAAERCADGWPCGTLDALSDPSLLLGEAGIGWLFLRLADPAVGSVLLLQPAGADAPSLAAPAPRAPALGAVRHRFGRTLAVLDALMPSARAAVEGDAAAAPDGGEARAAWRTLAGLARTAVPDGSPPDGSTADGSTADGSTADGPLAKPATLDGSAPDGSAADGMLADGMLADALRLDAERFAAALHPFPPAAHAPAAGPPTPWDAAWIAPAPGVQVVESARDWDGWLQSPPDVRGEAPPPDPAFHLLLRAGADVHTVRLLPFAAVVLRAAQGGGRLRDLAERVRTAFGEDAPPADALMPAVVRQLEALHARGAVRADAASPLERAVDGLTRALAGGDAVPGQAADGALRRVLEAAPAEVAREDRLYAHLRMESDAATVREALAGLFMEPFFASELDHVEAALRPGERTAAYAALLEPLRQATGGTDAPLVVPL